MTLAQRKWCVCILPRLAHVPSGPDRGEEGAAGAKTAAASLRPPELDVAPPPCLAPGAMAPQRPQIQFQPPSPDSFPVQAVVMQQPLISSLAPAARLPISNSLLSGPPTGTQKPTSGGGWPKTFPRPFIACRRHHMTRDGGPSARQPAVHRWAPRRREHAQVGQTHDGGRTPCGLCRVRPCPPSPER